MRSKLWFATALGLAAMVAVWAAESGPAAGSDAPMIHIDAVNDDDGSFCVTCRAGLSPTVVAFISADSEESRKLVLAVNESAKQFRDRRLNTALIYVGGDADFRSLGEWCHQQEITAPMARLAANAEELKNWKLNGEAKTTTVFIKQHKVVDSVGDIAVAQFKQCLTGLFD